jgi:ABC-type amino acid transport substrate-binding protein
MRTLWVWLVCACWALPAWSASQRLALVIGNDSYSKIPALVAARNDARAMADALQKVNYRVTLHLDLDQRGMLQAVRNFKAQVQGGDEVVFFFAGHGVQLGPANYLLPVDLAADNEEQIRDDALPLQRVLDDIAEKRARFSLAIVDACRNNPFKGHGRSIGGTRGLAPTTAATGQMVIYSAGTGQQALDSLGDKDPVKNGLFTRVFVKEMLAPDVPIDRVLKNVRLQVRNMALGVGHEQVPAIYDQVAGDFFFVASQPGGPTQPVFGSGVAAAPAFSSPPPAAVPVVSAAASPTRPPETRPAAAPLPQAPAPVAAAAKDDDDLVLAWQKIQARGDLGEGPRRAAAPPPSSRQASGGSRAGSTGGAVVAAAAPAVASRSIVPASTLPMQRIQSTRSIVLGVRDDVEPLSYAQSAGRFGGFHVALCQRIAEDLHKSLGGAPLEVKYRVIANREVVPMLVSGQIDLDCGATVNTAARQAQIAFAPTTFVEEGRVVVKANSGIRGVAGLAGKRVMTVAGGVPGAALKATAETRNLAFEDIPGADALQAFMLLEADMADALLVDGATAALLVSRARNPSAFRVLDGSFSADPLAIAMARDDATLRAAVQDTVKTLMSSGEIQRLYAQSFANQPAGSATAAAWATPSDRPSASNLR